MMPFKAAHSMLLVYCMKQNLAQGTVSNTGRMDVQYFCDVAVYPMVVTNTENLLRNYIQITPNIKKCRLFSVTKVWLNHPLNPVTSSNAPRKLVFQRSRSDYP